MPEVFFQLYARYSIIGWLEAGYFLINALILIKRRRQADLFVLGAAGLAFGVFGVAFATPWHTLDTLPMAVMAVAAGLNAGAERLAAMINSLKAHPWPKIDIGLLAVLCAAPLLAGYVGLSFYYVYANRDYDYFGYVKNLQALVPPQAVILGEGTWWWGFINQPYWWDEELANTQPQTPAQAQKLVQDIMAERKITTIFRDENLGLEVQSYGSQSLMETALDQYLSEKCQVTGTVARIAYGIDFNGPGIKRTRIYECHPN